MPTAPATLIESARRALGPVGAFLPVQMTSAPPVEQQRDAARRLERAGYPTAWTNEAVGGKDALVQIAVLLAATERMVFGTGIANIWARPPQTAHAAAALPAQAYPGRFVRGLGVGYPEQATSVGQRVRQSAAHDARLRGRYGSPAPSADSRHLLPPHHRGQRPQDARAGRRAG